MCNNWELRERRSLKDRAGFAASWLHIGETVLAVDLDSCRELTRVAWLEA